MLDALVLRLEGELAAVEVVETGLVAGGAATNAVCLHRARDAGLGGLEFACAIPGTAGGGVVMNAGAYGRDWSDVLVRALVVTADGEKWVTPDDLGLAYRHSALGAGQVVARVEYRLERRPPADIRATVAELIAQRKATQPTNKRTFGSVFKNPAGETGAGRMLELCGLKGHRIGGAMISPKHANFIENADGATSADCVALMVEARRRAREEFGVVLEREVVFVGLPELPRSSRRRKVTTPRPRSGRLQGSRATGDFALADLRSCEGSSGRRLRLGSRRIQPHGRGTKCARIASARCCGKRRRPVSARCGRCSP